MGVDAGIFAKKAKKYFWYDRDYNLSRYWDDGVSKAIFDRCESIRQHLNDRLNTKVTAAEVIFLAQANINAWLAGPEDQRSRAINVEGVKAFAEAHPNDEFFIETDSGDAYDLIGEMNGEKDDLWTGEYMEWKLIQDKE